MAIKQNKFQALCKCNTYTDIGSHTGFKWVERSYEHLLIGEWYTFIKDDYNVFSLLIDGKTHFGNGYTFGLRNHEHINFYHFFSTLEESRDIKLKQILE